MELVAEKYKQTEVGLIPSDWEVYFLGSLLKGIADVDHYMPKTENYGVPYVMTGDLEDYAGDIDFDSCKKISYDDYEKLSKKVRNLKGDIILARYATVGTVSYVNIDFDFVVSYSCVTIKPDKSRLFDLYLYYYFKSHIFRLEVKNKVNANIQDNVGIGDLLKMQIPLPPTKAEQTAIATALSDADALISSLSTLIAKKRNIKQGAMQKLLQPREGWEVKKLGEIGECIIGLTYTPENVKENGTLVLRSSNVQGNSLKYDDNVFVDSKIPEKLINQENDILICVRNGSRDLIGKCALLTGRAIGETFGAFMSVFRSPFNPFVFVLFQSEIIKKQIDEHLGATINQITNKSLNSFEIPFPPNEEQTHIATILSDLDAEIIALETKLEKYKKVKLGMMQNLLTGKIRLV